MTAEASKVCDAQRAPLQSAARPNSPGGVAERLIAPVLKTGRPKVLVSSNLTPSATINFGFPISDLRSAAEENARRSERRRSPRPQHRQHLRDNARRDTFAISRSE